VLDVKELEELLRTICDRLPRKQEAEFTVEAGRPDTLDLSKLKLLKQYGVNRLSINPQSMQEKTLDRIGRTHGSI